MYTFGKTSLLPHGVEGFQYAHVTVVFTLSSGISKLHNFLPGILRGIGGLLVDGHLQSVIVSQHSL